MPATATAAAEAAEVGKQPPQPQPQTQPSPSSPSSSATTSKSFRQIIQSSAIGRAADFYSRIQSRRPYWTQLWCTLFIYLCGDLSAQLFVGDGGGKAKDKDKDMEKKVNKKNGEQERGMGDEVEKEGVMARYDPLRTVRHMTVGALAAVPGYKWFMYLHNNFNFRSKPRFVSIITKVAINQVCFTPIFNTYFFCMQSLLAGTSLTETWERLKLALPTSIVNSAKLWPAVTAFMFMYVDPQFRNIFAGAIAVGWQTYLSWLNQKAAKEVEAAEAAQAQAQAVEVEGVRQDGGGVGVMASVAATS
ncbi:integral membrane protein [Histoplasma capsulatum]|uniref:Integral membrane protein n=1 Tax=Ajellomyces capsulatus TaxID=5037 RepID=A0A8A1M3E6_AJECA|nr:integral membrane protein [Histoplasma capsulatum]